MEQFNIKSIKTHQFFGSPDLKCPHLQNQKQIPKKAKLISNLQFLKCKRPLIKNKKKQPPPISSPQEGKKGNYFFGSQGLDYENIDKFDNPDDLSKLSKLSSVIKADQMLQQQQRLRFTDVSLFQSRLQNTSRSLSPQILLTAQKHQLQAPIISGKAKQLQLNATQTLYKQEEQENQTSFLRFFNELKNECQRKNGLAKKQITNKKSILLGYLTSLLAKEQTMFQKETYEIKNQLDLYLFCQDEELLQLIRQIKNEDTIFDKHLTYKKVCHILLKVVNDKDIDKQTVIQQFNVENQAKVDDIRKLDKKIEELKQQYNKAKTEFQKQYQNEKDQFQEKIKFLETQIEDLSFQNNQQVHIFRELEEVLLNEKKEKALEFEARLETQIQQKTYLQEKIEEMERNEVELRIQHNNMYENQKNAVITLKANRKRIKELEYKYQYIYDENISLKHRAGNIDITPRPDLSKLEKMCNKLMPEKDSISLITHENKRSLSNINKKSTQFRVQKISESFEEFFKQLNAQNNLNYSQQKSAQANEQSKNNFKSNSSPMSAKNRISISQVKDKEDSNLLKQLTDQKISNNNNFNEIQEETEEPILDDIIYYQPLQNKGSISKIK